MNRKRRILSGAAGALLSAFFLSLQVMAAVTVDIGTFVNEYTPGTGETTAQITAQKVLNGKTLTDGAFEFTLMDDKGSTLDTVTNDADGSIEFDEITFYEAGTYCFYLEEVVGTDSNMSYDTTTYEITVTVTDDGDGCLEATVSNVPTFTNTYVTVNTTTTDSGTDTTLTDQKTSDDTALGIYVGLVIAGLAGVMFIVLKKRRQE